MCKMFKWIKKLRCQHKYVYYNESKYRIPLTYGHLKQFHFICKNCRNIKIIKLDEIEQMYEKYCELNNQEVALGLKTEKDSRGLNLPLQDYNLVQTYHGNAAGFVIDYYEKLGVDITEIGKQYR